jgi:hypothetical protein
MPDSLNCERIHGRGVLSSVLHDSEDARVEYEIELPLFYQEEGVNISRCPRVISVGILEGGRVPATGDFVLTDEQGRQHYLYRFSEGVWHYRSTPGPETIEALLAARRGELTRIGSPKELLASLHEGD